MRVIRPWKSLEQANVPTIWAYAKNVYVKLEEMGGTPPPFFLEMPLLIAETSEDLSDINGVNLNERASTFDICEDLMLSDWVVICQFGTECGQYCFIPAALVNENVRLSISLTSAWYAKMKKENDERIAAKQNPLN